MYGTPAKMLLLADVGEYSFTNAAQHNNNIIISKRCGVVFEIMALLLHPVPAGLFHFKKKSVIFKKSSQNYATFSHKNIKNLLSPLTVHVISMGSPTRTSCEVGSLSKW